jgi:hypothetical protein
VNLPADVLVWAKDEGFVPTPGTSMEIAWPHDSGYGYITFRLMPIAGGEVWIIVEGPGGSVNLGAYKTVAEIQEVYALLSKKRFDVTGGGK